VVTLQRKQKPSTKTEPELPSFGAAQVTANNSGNFVLRNLAPGQYGLEARFFAHYWYLQSITQRATASSKEIAGQTIDLARSSLTLRLGEGATGVRVTLAEGGATLSGQVETTGNQSLPAQLFVYLVPAEKEKVDDPLQYSAAQVDGHGAFAIDQVAPGRYWLITKTAADNLSSNKSLRSPDAHEARAKLWREAESMKSEVALKPCQNVSGYSLVFK
jgi:hypothetical protein